MDRGYSDEDIVRCREEAIFRKLDKKRKLALFRRDAKTYAILCDQLGIEPEVRELYDQRKL